MFKKLKGRDEYLEKLESKALWRFLKVTLVSVGAISSLFLAVGTVATIYNHDDRVETIGCSGTGSFGWACSNEDRARYQVIDHEPENGILYILYWVFFQALYLLIAYLLFILIRRVSAYIILGPNKTAKETKSEHKEKA